MRLLSRRTLLAAAAMLAVRPAVAARLALDSVGNDQVALRFEGVEGAIMVPSARARIAFALPIAGREVAGVAFGADAAGTTLDLVALCGWDGACLRLLGLELLSLSGAGGANLA